MTPRPSDAAIREKAALLCEEFAKVMDTIGVDLSPAMAQFQQERIKDARFLAAQIRTLPLASAPLVRDYRKDAENFITQRALSEDANVGITEFAAHLAATADQTERTP